MASGAPAIVPTVETWLILIGPLAGALVGAAAAIAGGAWQERRREKREAQAAARLLSEELTGAARHLNAAAHRHAWPHFSFDARYELLRPLPAVLPFNEWRVVQRAVRQVQDVLITRDERIERAQREAKGARLPMHWSSASGPEDWQAMGAAAGAAQRAVTILHRLAIDQARPPLDPRRLMSGQRVGYTR